MNLQSFKASDIPSSPKEPPPTETQALCGINTRPQKLLSESNPRIRWCDLTSMLSVTDEKEHFLGPAEYTPDD